MKAKRETLGIDIGNVIINHRLTDKNDATLREERYSTIPAADGVCEVIKELNEKNYEKIFRCEWKSNIRNGT